MKTHIPELLQKPIVWILRNCYGDAIELVYSRPKKRVEHITVGTIFRVNQKKKIQHKNINF